MIGQSPRGPAWSIDRQQLAGITGQPRIISGLPPGPVCAELSEFEYLVFVTS